MQLVLANRGKHRITFEMLDLMVMSALLGFIDALSKGEIYQVIIAIRDTYVVEFEVPMTVSNLVKLVECLKHLLAHLNDPEFKIWGLRGRSALHEV